MTTPQLRYLDKKICNKIVYFTNQRLQVMNKFCCMKKKYLKNKFELCNLLKISKVKGNKYDYFYSSLFYIHIQKYI